VAKGVVLALLGVAAGLIAGAIVVVAIAALFFGWDVVTVKSGSMEPEFGKGDLVISRPTDLAKVKETDIILFADSAGQRIVHRVIAINRVVLETADSQTGVKLSENVSYRFVTKGDANQSADTFEPSGSAVDGKVWLIIPGFGLLGDLPLTGVFLIALVGLMFAWIVWEIYGRATGRGKKKRRKRRSPSGASRKAPQPGTFEFRHLRVRGPSFRQRAGDWAIDRLDDGLYLGARSAGAVARVPSRIGRRLRWKRRLREAALAAPAVAADQPGTGSATRAAWSGPRVRKVMAWGAVPVTIWTAALGVVLASGASATNPTWTTSDDGPIASGSANTWYFTPTPTITGTARAGSAGASTPTLPPPGAATSPTPSCTSPATGAASATATASPSAAATTSTFLDILNRIAAGRSGAGRTPTPASGGTAGC
jgi:signal peptidase